jgi:hypothetical protein
MINSMSYCATSVCLQVLRSVGVVLLAGIAGCGAPSDQSHQGLGSSSSDLTADRFRGWTFLGFNNAGPYPPIFTSGVAVDARGPITIDLFARGSDNALYYNYAFTTNNWATANFSGWSSYDGVLLGRPSACAWGDTNQYFVVAGRGTNNQAYVRLVVPAETDSGTLLTDWTQVSNGVLSNEPAVTVMGRYQIYVFANGTDNGVYWSHNDVTHAFDPNNWSAWRGPIPQGVLSAEPAAGAFGSTLYVVGRGTTNFYHLTKSSDGGTTWSPWAVIDASHTFTTGPALSVSPNGRLDVFGVLSNGHMYGLTSIDGGNSWGAPVDAGGNLAASVGAVASANGIIQTFGLNTDGTISGDLYKE